ncbi:unnamed protein product, partial [Rotaria magnacalcarata]
MGKLDLAEQYYTRFLKELSPDDPSIISVYADLADIASLQGYYDKSMELQQKLYDIKKQNPRFDYITK